jgi:tetratricopeptide (TPR) repeat protein
MATLFGNQDLAPNIGVSEVPRWYKPRTVRRVLSFAIVALVFFSSAASELSGGQVNHEGHQGGGPVPREILERPVPLRQGIGSVHEAVTTSSPEAQSFYDQGLAYAHSFMWIEAARSFHQALRLDPNLAMAYLGLTDTYIGLHDAATARAAFQRAQELAPRVSERERAWITIRECELDYIENSASQESYALYRQALKEAIKVNPNDPWLWIQRGLADEANPFAHGQAGGVDTLSFYKTAVTLAPGNSVAHHYYAHSYENAGRAKEALSETEIYLRTAPAIPHAHHMRGHELLRLGRTEEAIHEFVKTKELEDEYYRTENIPARYDWHHAHNLQLLGMSYQSLGQMKAAEAAFREAFSVPTYTDFLEYNRKAWPEFLLRRGRFEEALAASQQLIKSPWAIARLAGHTLAGQALLAADRVNDAKDELNLAERETEQLPPAALAALPFPGLLWANILLREKKTEEGEALTREIEKMVRAMPGPDAWSAARFELEGIAQTAREAGDWELAEFTAQQMIQHDPSYAAGYFALGLAIEHAGDGAKARQQFAMAEKLWSKADKDLPELERIREKVAARR